ncbi:MAG TPA: hypothetical protein VHB77_15325 [Planctomycetaceae bacterium]|nr:hypothetical protein [Planctomycetaceae bacterium]
MRTLTGLLLLLLIVPGCSGGSGKLAAPKLYPVKGNLKIDGKPTEGITVQLSPADPESKAQPASGVTDADGNFTIRTNGDRGATEGKFKVVLGMGTDVKTQGPMSLEEATKLSGAGTKYGGMPTPKYPFPIEWASPLTTPKTVDVTSQGAELNIDI